MFTFGKQSLSKLEGVDGRLVTIAMRALEISHVDFSIIEGVRDKARQAVLFNSGASQTMDSMHLTGHAIDVAAWLDGESRYDFGLMLQIARAMRDAALEKEVSLVWGASWSVINNAKDLSAEVAHYVERKKRQKEAAFIDACHFQIARSAA